MSWLNVSFDLNDDGIDLLDRLPHAIKIISAYISEIGLHFYTRFTFLYLVYKYLYLPFLFQNCAIFVHSLNDLQVHAKTSRNLIV